MDTGGGEEFSYQIGENQARGPSLLIQHDPRRIIGRIGVRL